MEKVMILMSNYRYAESIREMVDWQKLGLEIVSIEYNGALGLEQFSYFKPRIVLLDSVVPVIGTDRFMEEMINVHSDFFVILLDDMGINVSNVQHIFRILKRSGLRREDMERVLRQCVEALNVPTVDYVDENGVACFDFLQEKLGDGLFSVNCLRELRGQANVVLTPRVRLLLPRPSRALDHPVSNALLAKIRCAYSRSVSGECFLMESGIICILFNVDVQIENHERAFENAFIDIRRVLTREYPVHWTFIFSDPVYLNQLGREFPKYRTLYDMGYFLSEMTILKPEYVTVKSSLSKKISKYNLLYSLLCFMERSDYEAVFQSCKMLYAEYLKQRRSIDEVDMWRYTLAALCYSFARMHNASGTEVLNCAITGQFYTLEQELQAVTMLLSGAIDIYRAHNSINPLIYQIMAIVLEGFSDVIMLQEVAYRVNISPTYLSHLFKKATGVSFVEYVSDIRVFIAKMMLLDEKRKVGEIAEKTGFSDYRYFSRVFRSFTEMTPSEFRQMKGQKRKTGGEQLYESAEDCRVQKN